MYFWNFVRFLCMRSMRISQCTPSNLPQCCVVYYCIATWAGFTFRICAQTCMYGSCFWPTCILWKALGVVKILSRRFVPHTHAMRGMPYATLQCNALSAKCRPCMLISPRVIVLCCLLSWPIGLRLRNISVKPFEKRWRKRHLALNSSSTQNLQTIFPFDTKLHCSTNSWIYSWSSCCLFEQTLRLDRARQLCRAGGSEDRTNRCRCWYKRLCKYMIRGVLYLILINYFNLVGAFWKID